MLLQYVSGVYVCAYVSVHAYGYVDMRYSVPEPDRGRYSEFRGPSSRGDEEKERIAGVVEIMLHLPIGCTK